jgi:DNA-binding transcriptional LysR family regulator
VIAAVERLLKLWIVPRLAQIARRLPQTQFSFETINNLPDYDRSEADFDIRFGEGNWGRPPSFTQLYATGLVHVELLPLLCSTLSSMKTRREGSIRS